MGPGVQLDHRELAFAALDGDLTNANFSGSNLANAQICCSLQDADFSGTIVRGSILYGIQSEQLYSTQSYKDRDLSGVYFAGFGLAGLDLSHQNLSNSVLRFANFTNLEMVNADLTGADLRRSLGTPDPSVNLRNAIHSDGEIRGLNLLAGDTLTLLTADLCSMECGRVGVKVSQSFVVAEGAQLEVLIQQGKGIGFHTPIEIHDSTSVTLGGTLKIVDSKWGLGRPISGTIDLFDWPDPLDVANRFDAVVAPRGLLVDTSQLYSTGEVTLFQPDTNLDGKVDIIDLNDVRNNFGLSGDSIVGGDTNFDRQVDITDLNNVRNFFGATTPQAVPEPSTFAIGCVAMASIAIVFRSGKTSAARL